MADPTGTQSHVLGRGILRTAIPLGAPRYDDTSWIQVENIREWLERGMSCSMAVNLNFLRDGGPYDPGSPTGKMRLQDLDYLLGIAAKNNVTLELLQHNNDNLATAPNTTWDDMLESLDVSGLRAFSGQETFGYIQPGDANPVDWARKNHRTFVAAMKQSGISWAQGLVTYVSMADLDNTATISVSGMWTNSSVDWWDPSAIANGWQVVNFGNRPGWIADPYSLPLPTTVDLGSHIVPRGLSDGQGGYIDDPNSGARPWILGFDNNGLGAEGGSFSADLSRILQYTVLRALGYGLWQMWGMHGDARCDLVQFGGGGTNAAPLSANRGSSGTPSTLPGHFSSVHFADFVSRLRDAGHIRVGTATEWASELLSQFAEGLDIVDNPGLRVPFYDCDEDLNDGLGHIPFIRGASLKGVGSNTNSRTMWPVHLSDDPDANGDVTTRPDLYMNPQVSGLNGRPGGVVLKYGGDQDITGLALGGTGLAPGLYRVSLDVSGYTGTSAIFTTSAMGLLGIRARYRAETAWANEASTVAADFHLVQANRIYNQMDGPDGGGTIQFYLDCPANPTPHKTGTIVAAITDLADGSEVSLGTVTVAGVVRGGRCIAFAPKTALAAGVGPRAEVVARDTVEIFVHNDTGAPLSISSTEWTAVVDVPNVVDLAPVDGGPTQPWTYAWLWQTACDGTQTRTVGGFQVELLKRYL